jgi:hypothetical protein
MITEAAGVVIERSGHRGDEPMMTQLRRRRAMENPRAITGAADGARADQLAHRCGDRWTVCSDKIRQALMGQRQRHGDPV